MTEFTSLKWEDGHVNLLFCEVDPGHRILLIQPYMFLGNFLLQLNYRFDEKVYV